MSLVYKPRNSIDWRNMGAIGAFVVAFTAPRNGAKKEHSCESANVTAMIKNKYLKVVNYLYAWEKEKYCKGS
ncbi:MAG: hypothetical protein SCJ97_11430 [Bacillota bacterium]|nr:hypothetical protein [Bacillota bacterium]